MRMPASLGKHPIHPMLVTVPIGLWIFSLACDLLFVLGSGASLWYTLAFYTLIGGLAGAVIAAVPGFIDLLSLAGSVRRVALAHMALSLVVIALYAVNIGLRINQPEKVGVCVTLSAVAVALLVLAGWLGGHLVYVYRVGVDTLDGSEKA